MKKLAILFSIAFLGTTGPALVYAAVTEVEQCRTVKSNVKRLQCYDIMPTAAISNQSMSSAKIEKIEWISEPDSFLNIKLDKDIGASFSSACPSKTMSSFESFDEYKWSQQGKPRCFFDRPSTKPHWGEFKGHGVEAFRQEQIFLYKDSMVGKAVVRFFSSQYADMTESLTKKYGPPTNTTKTTVKLNNGGELPNEISVWLGKKAVLSIEALEKRDATSAGMIDYGKVTWTSLEYMDESSKINEKKNQDRAEKF